MKGMTDTGVCYAAIPQFWGGRCKQKIITLCKLSSCLAHLVRLPSNHLNIFTGEASNPEEFILQTTV